LFWDVYGRATLDISLITNGTCKAIELLECQVLSWRKKAPQREALRKGLVLYGELITSENLTEFFGGEVEVYTEDVI